MDWKFLFLSFKGRISRLNWWIGAVLVVLLNYAVSIAVLWLLGGDPAYYWNDELPTPKVSLADSIAFVATLHFSFSVDIKRIHDRGLSAYYLVPIYLIELGIILSQSYGWDHLLQGMVNFELNSNMPFEVYVIGAFIALLLIYSLWILIELGFRKGTTGESRYGSDPLGSKDEV